MVFGVVIGSAVWWMFLSGAVTFFLHKRMTDLWLHIINRFSGVIIMIFGIFALKVLYKEGMLKLPNFL